MFGHNLKNICHSLISIDSLTPSPPSPYSPETPEAIKYLAINSDQSIEIKLVFLKVI